MPVPDPKLPKVICLAGPTGCGKTALALTLAQEFDCEIVNADSRQVYADFPVITAQPGPEQLGKAPHHLYGFMDTAAKLGAGQWASLASEKCREIAARGRLPLVVGGTGFYFAALLQGLAEIPGIAPEIGAALAARLEEEGASRLYAELGRCDPDYAAKIHPADRQRILRALEVKVGTGRSFTWWHVHSRRRPKARGQLFAMSCTLAWLAPRLIARIGTMLDQGAVAEARAAARRNSVGAAWSGIGCAELARYLTGALSLAECRELWARNTRAYAKRQLTWLRSRREAVWFAPEEPEPVFAACRGLRSAMDSGYW